MNPNQPANFNVRAPGRKTDQAAAPERSIAMRALRVIWNRRIAVARSVQAAGHALWWIYDKSPLPRRVKDITAELTYHAIEHFIVQSESYQNWLHRSGGLTRLHGLFRREREETPAPIHAPSDIAWQSLIRSFTPSTTQTRVVVIIPVYKGYHETLACLFSVLKAPTVTPFHLLLINDASPDTALVAKLEELAQHGLFELVHHSKNMGFVRTVNEGMALYPSHDVLLLNADTEVYAGWLDRMIAALERSPQTASVTPFSNNAELCSYPRSFHGNQTPLEVEYATLDRLVAKANEGVSPELPTAVGFCMLLRRAAIEQVGLFDDDAFGRGYGEENDWCLRAADAGWRHVLAADVFVRHAGAVSFEAGKQRELKRSLRHLNERHPHYRELVRSFRTDDPLLPYRRAIDLERLKAQRLTHAFLMVSHNAGGGTEKHVRDMAARLLPEGVTSYRLSPHPEYASQVRLWHHNPRHYPNLAFDMDDEQELLEQHLRALEITHIHIHHLLGFPNRMVALLPLLASRLGVPYDVSVHDYYLACPSINMVYESGAFKANPTIAESQQWAAHHPTVAGRIPIWLWRHQHQQLLEGARRVITPSEDCGARIEALFPGINAWVRYHPDEQQSAPNLYLHHIPHTALDVAVLGKLTSHKGGKPILAMARDARARGLPIHFHIFGEAEQAQALKKTGQVTVHGAYEEGAIYEHLTRHRCHMALIASVWPETYTYTLSIAFNGRVYPVCFDLGAPAERIRKAEWGSVLPLDAMHQPSLANDLLLALNTTPPPTARSAHQAFHSYPNMLRDYYGMEDAPTQSVAHHR